jgi:hypothetical protein
LPEVSTRPVPSLPALSLGTARSAESAQGQSIEDLRRALPLARPLTPLSEDTSRLLSKAAEALARNDLEMAAAAAKDTEWARRVDGFVQTRVLGYESLSKGAQAKLHGTFQEVVDEVLEALLEATGIEGEALLHEVMQMTPESLRLPSTHRARALQMLALDNAKALHTLMMSEHSAALADPVRRAALVAGANATWQSQVRIFHSPRPPSTALLPTDIPSTALAHSPPSHRHPFSSAR